MAGSRFFNNNKVDKDKILSEIYDQNNVNCAGKDVLCIQDTTEYNFTSKENKLKQEELGPITKSNNVGYFVHPSLCIDIENCMPLGFSNLKIWSRDSNAGNKYQRKYAKLPINEKESYKWLEGPKSSLERLDKAKTVTHVGDRESDIYELLTMEMPSNHFFLIRCKTTRNLTKSQEEEEAIVSLFEYIKSQQVQGTAELKVKSEIRKDRLKRNLVLNIKYGQVSIKRPANLKGKLPESKTLYYVEAEEINPPSMNDKIHWRLLTTHQVLDLETGLKMLKLYSMRWQVEELFAVTKQKGFRLEDSQLETEDALFKLTVLIYIAALKVLCLTKGRTFETISAKAYFTETEIKIMQKLHLAYEGKTEKQKNHNKKYSLAWATWIIGRMGGWKGYSGYKPGIKTMKLGLDKLEAMVTYELAT